MPARRRPRSEMTRSPQQRAIAIAIKNRAKYPYSRYGRAYLERGTDDNLAIFGPTFREATAEQRANRRKIGYTGRGAYWGNKVGTWLGRRTGIPGAGKLAGMAGSKLEDLARKRFSGRGLYVGRGQYNNLIEGGDMSMVGSGDETESVIFTNREYIKDVYGPEDGSFTNYALNLNPGLENVFPWLAQVAANYEEYEFIQLLFEFKSTVNPSTAGDGQTGTVIMATNYNASEKEFGDKAAMMQYHGGCSGRLTEDLIHGIECSPNKSVGDMHKYVRTDPVDDDIKSYDHGKFNFAIANMPSEFKNQQVGELWVTYRIKLLKPKLGVARLINQSIDRFTLNYNNNVVTAVTAGTSELINYGRPFSNAKLWEHPENSIGCKLDVTNCKIVFPATTTGVFEVCVRCRFDAQGADNTDHMTSDYGLTSVLDGAITLHDQLFLPSEGTTNTATYRYVTPPVHLASESNHVETQAPYISSVSNSLHIEYIAVISVKSAHDGTNNTLQLKFKNSDGASISIGLNSCMIEIKEVKDMQGKEDWVEGDKSWVVPA